VSFQIIRARTKARKQNGKNDSKNGFDRAAIDWARDVRLPNDATLKKLSPRACRRGTVKSVLMIIAFRVNAADGHSTYWGLDRLARDSGFDERTVRLALTLLEQLGLLHREQVKRKTDTIFLHVGAKCPGTVPAQFAKLSGHTAHSTPGTLPGHCPGINASKELIPSNEGINTISEVSEEEAHALPHNTDVPPGKTKTKTLPIALGVPAHELAAFEKLCADHLGYPVPAGYEQQLSAFCVGVRSALKKIGSTAAVADVLATMCASWASFTHSSGCWKLKGKPHPFPWDLDAAAASAAVAYHVKHAPDPNAVDPHTAPFDLTETPF
jgi:hypothetical protein